MDRLYREILELGIITSQKRIYGFQGFNALEKVQWTIKNQPKILQRVSNKMAASYLGISPSTLAALAFIFNKFGGLMALILLSVSINAVLFHVSLDPEKIWGALVLLALNITMLYFYRNQYKDLLKG